jgi:hypothetical protein
MSLVVKANSPVIFGQNTNTNTSTTSFGVRGECNATGAGSAGVYGYSSNAGQNELGVKGSYILWGAAVLGQAWNGAGTPPNTLDYGMFGSVSYYTGHGGYFENNSTGGGYGIEGVSPASGDMLCTAPAILQRPALSLHLCLHPKEISYYTVQRVLRTGLKI